MEKISRSFFAPRSVNLLCVCPRDEEKGEDETIICLEIYEPLEVFECENFI